MDFAKACPKDKARPSSRDGPKTRGTTLVEHLPTPRLRPCDGSLPESLLRRPPQRSPFGLGSPDLTPRNNVSGPFQPMETSLWRNVIRHRGFRFIAFDGMLV